MAFLKCGGSGGTTPTYEYSTRLKNATETYTIDTTKNYLIFTCLTYNDKLRVALYTVINDVVTEVVETADTFATITVSGATLTLQSTNSYNNTAFMIVSY